MSKKIQTVCIDTLNAIQNNQYMSMLDKKTMVTRDKWKDFSVDIYAFIIDDLKRMGFENVLILGHPGTGKSFGIKYLEPGTNIWYNADDKNPTFRNVKFNDKEFKASKVYGTRMNPTSYMRIPKTYSDISNHIKALIKKGHFDDFRVAFILGHVEDYKTKDGEVNQRLMLLGNLAKRLNIEGSVENCYYSEVEVIGDDTKFLFNTLNTGTNTGRAKEDLFSSRYIDNNFHTIYKALKEY